MAKTIFEETQEERDIELAKFYGLSVKSVKHLTILAPESLQIFKNEDIAAPSYDHLYTEFKYMNPVHYIRTLSYVTIEQRASYIYSMEEALRGLFKKQVLDYGCGVGSHGIYCLQKGAIVDFLDVDGPLYNYAKHRINNRKLSVQNYLYPNSNLASNSYDAVICLDVLEHVSDPIAAMVSIANSLKKNGVLCLEVSQQVKPTSGHFSQVIKLWQRKHTSVMSQFVHVDKYIYRKK